jgi:hypothetical protein
MKGEQMQGQVFKEGKYLKIKKNEFYEGIDGARYIARSRFKAMGEGVKIAIIERQEILYGRFVITHLTMSPEELKDILGIKKRGLLSID